ncbi:MAG: CBS domain-containing protein [Rhodospirillales bacterium]|nr:CBS domain-containing protein [Rhodospirillales bacterium]
MVELLRRRPPFDVMEAEHLAWVAGRLRPAHYRRDTVILPAGMAATRLLFITEGAVRVEDSSGRAVAELVAGECFPLESLDPDGHVNATFRARQDSGCHALESADIAELQRLSPPFAEFCRHRTATFLDNARRRAGERGPIERPGLNGRLGELMRGTPITCPPETPLRQVLAIMNELHLGSMIVADAEKRPLGIFTLPDVLSRVVMGGLDLDLPIARAMTPRPVTLPASAAGHDAAVVMARHGFRHIIVEDQGRIVGIVTEHDLFKVERASKIADEIRRAGSVADLAAASTGIQRLAFNLLSQGVPAAQINQVISTLNDQLTERVIDLELAGADLDGLRFCWMTMGSEGRGEQTLYTDQDNGIIFALPPGMSAEQARQKLLPLAQRINEALDVCGFPKCKGGIMAGNPKWCLSLEEWRDRFTAWINQPEPEALLNATIFFDFRGLCGDLSLAEDLRVWLTRAARGQNRFLHLMVENAANRSPPLGFFRDFVVDREGLVDLKLGAVALFVDAARILALANGVAACGTRDRLREAAALAHLPAGDVDAWIEAFHFVQALRLRHQYDQQHRGEALDNRINPHDLNALDRRIFLEALRQAGRLQKRLSQAYAIKTQTM